MISSNTLKNLILAFVLSFVLSACATQTKKVDSQIEGDVYTGTDTVEYLATGVPDRVFFATNESVLTTASRDTLRKQAAWLRKNENINVMLGHSLGEYTALACSNKISLKNCSLILKKRGDAGRQNKAEMK